MHPRMNSTVFQFDRYTLDLSRASLRLGDKTIELRPKTFDVLRFLIENTGRVISKDEIFAAVWPDVTVTDDSLVQCVREIRQAIKDDEQRIIKTVPRRGYLFDAPVTSQIATAPLNASSGNILATAWQSRSPPNAAAPGRKAKRILVVVSALALLSTILLLTRPFEFFYKPQRAAGPPSIAVLFSATRSGNDRTYDYFSDGLTDDLIAALGRFTGLRVFARTALNKYKDNLWEPQQLWRDLNARYILDGVVRRSGDRIRVTARLMDAAQHILLWSDTYDEEIKDIFVVQDRLTRSIAGRLAVRINRIEQERVAAIPTRNMQAYDYVLRGREKLAKITRADNLEARRLFRSAADLDSRYAAAFVGLGHTNHNDILFGWNARPEESLRRAYEFAHRAISLDDKDPAGYLLLSNIYVISREYTLALAEADRGIELNPNDADGHAVRAAVLVWMGRIDEAIATFESVAQLDPGQSRPRSLAHLGIAYFLAARYEDAVRAFELSIGRNPEFALGYIGLAAAYSELNKKSDAARLAAVVRRLDPFFASETFGTQFAVDTHRLQMVESLKKAGL